MTDPYRFRKVPPATSAENGEKFENRYTGAAAPPARAGRLSVAVIAVASY